MSGVTVSMRVSGQSVLCVMCLMSLQCDTTSDVAKGGTELQNPSWLYIPVQSSLTVVVQI